ncbi:MAG: hypothetical protein JWN17_1167 [Frankiales bacterium]|nr:hypothetical protein [Frankiales bacterium]
MTETSDVRLLVQGADQEWRPPAVTRWPSEASLQELLQEQPSLLPGPPRPRVAVREFFLLGTGYADLVVVDEQGDITVVECKLEKNPEIRREVVGQVLAYASALWRLDLEEFSAGWAASARLSGRSSLREDLQEIVVDGAVDEVLAAVERNLAQGRFRLVLAVDRLTEELERIVRFLNTHTSDDVEVLALAVAYAEEGGVRMLLPSTTGQESAADKQHRPAPVWSQHDVEAAVQALPEPQRAVADVVLALPRSGWYESQAIAPAGTLLFDLGGGKPVSLLSLWLGEGPSSPSLSINFAWARDNLSTQQLKELADRLREVPGVPPRLAGLEQAGFAKRPGLPLALLAGHTALLDAALRAALRAAPRSPSSRGS